MENSINFKTKFGWIFVREEKKFITEIKFGKKKISGKKSHNLIKVKKKINYLKKFGIKDIIICSGYKGKKIENYIKKKKNFGCNIEYSVETSPLGTGGAIKKAIKNIVDDSFIVLNGDIITNINLK